MKIAAILIPLAIFLIPTIMQVVMAIRYGTKGKDPFKNSHPMTANKRKKLITFVYVYMCALVASISWAVYVFSSNFWLSISIGLAGIAIVSITLSMGTRKASKLPTPPPEGYPDSKTELDALNKRADIQSEDFLKGMKRYLVIGIPLIILICIIVAIIASCLSK